MIEMQGEWRRKHRCTNTMQKKQRVEEKVGRKMRNKGEHGKRKINERRKDKKESDLSFLMSFFFVAGL